MATIITREVGATAKGSTLSNTELDNNFINLNTDIGTRIPSSEKGSANGVATLDATGKVPSTQLPSYVDDVLEAANLAAFPATGETSKIYVALDTNKTYRWSGSAYVYITSGAVDSVAGKTGVVTLAKADVGLSSVDNTADSTKNVLSASKWTTARTLSFTGDVTGSGSVDGSANVATALTLANSGVAAGTYTCATYDAKGRATTGVATTIKQPVRVATTGENLSLSGLATIDGIVVATGDRVLVRTQSLQGENGVYVVSGSGAWSRATDANTSALLAGAIVPVSLGTVNSGKTFKTDYKASGTLGSTNVWFGELVWNTGTTGSAWSINISGSAGTLQTARTLTIGNTGKTFNGNTDVSWSLAEIGALGASAKAADSDLLDGYNSTAFSGPVSTIKEFFWDNLSASGTQARTFEIARLAVDYNDWNSGIGPFEVELYEAYYSRGLKKKYVIHWGYTNTYGIQLVEFSGSGDNNFQVRVGTPVLVSGDNYYLPVYVDVRYYSGVDVRVTTNRDITSSNPPGIGTAYINASPSATNISDFTPDSIVNFSSISTVQVAGNQLLHAGNYSSYALPLSGGTLTGVLASTKPINLSSATYGTQANLVGNWSGAGWWGLGSESGHIIKFDQVAYADTAAPTWVGATDVTLKLGTKTVLDSGNYNSYALPLSGGTLTGTLYTPKVIINANSDLSWGGNYGDGKSTISATGSAIYLYPAGNGSGATFTLDNSSTNVYRELYVSTGGSSQVRVVSPSGTQSLWIRAGYTANGTATPQSSPYNVQFQSSGNSGGTFSFCTGNDVTLSITGSYVNSAVALQQGGNQVLHVGNYNSYSPTLTGSGASGSWGISVTGSAATLTTARNFGTNSFAQGGGTVSFNGSGNVSIPAPVVYADVTTTLSTGISGYGNSMGMVYASDGPNGSSTWQRYLQMSYQDSSTNVWQTQLVQSGTSGDMWVRSREGGTLGSTGWGGWYRFLTSGNYNSYAPTLTGTGASGTWGISVSGNAATATALQTARTINGVSFNGTANITITAAANGGNADTVDNLHSTSLNVVVARYNNGGASASGRVQIKLPFLANSGKMLKFTVSLYANYTQHTYEISGYLYSTNNNWYTPTATYNGSGSPDIIFGREADGYAYVSIGSSAYVGVTVHSVTIGYTGSASDAVNIGWTITDSSSAPNTVSSTVLRQLDSSNYSSYALPIGGGTLTGQLNSSGGDSARLFQSNNASASGATQFFIEHSLGNVSIGNARGNINISSGNLLHGGNQVLHAGNYQSYLGDYTYGAYRVIADYSSSGTWYIRSNGNFIWARAHDWTQSFTLNLGNGTSASNNGWAELGQSASNNAAGTWYGTRFVQYTGSAKIDGYVRAGRYYLGDDTNYITSGGSGAMRSQTSTGYIDVGSMNASWAHFQTDRPSFYFNKDVYVDGQLYRYSGSAPYLHSANYNSYAPTLTGTGASGTWGISISGSAARLTNFTSTTTSSAGTDNAESCTSYISGISLFAQTDGALYSHVYSSSWKHNIYGDYRTGQLAVRGKNSGTWQAWRTVIDSGNYSSYALPLSGGTVTGATYFQSNQGTTSGSLTSPPLQVYATGTNAAYMSFHRSGNYAVNMGLDSDNVLRIGGWSASANRFQMDMSGNLTMAGNITAYSDERLKTDWLPLPLDFVERLAKIKSGTYTRIDSGERQAGASAQDWQQLLPEVVTTGADEEKILALAYGNAALVSAVELAKEVISLRDKLSKLEDLVQALINKG